MWIAAVVGGALAAVFVMFRGLQWNSDRTYRPSVDDVRNAVQASLEGRLGIMAFDEFSCVRIVYDPRLDRLRERYNSIVNDPACMAGRLPSQMPHPSMIKVDTAYGSCSMSWTACKPNMTFDRTAGSHALAAAGQRER
jgi:hypothetical protein